MPRLTILYWRDIPSQVIAKAGRRQSKRELSERFLRAIDAAAMRAGASDADAYLADWRRADPIDAATISMRKRTRRRRSSRGSTTAGGSLISQREGREQG